MRYIFNSGEKYEDWVLKKPIGKGGNGEVWLTENTEGNSGAIKLLYKLNKKDYERFRDEVTVVLDNNRVKGILPIWKIFLPEGPLEDNVPWYVMPLANPIEKGLGIVGKTIDNIVKAVICIAETMSELHDKGISHRDIKPGNLYYFSGNWCIGDFGLVDYPDKSDLTQFWEQVGPRWTIAPEMKRFAHIADGKPADVYSLAKTLWILLTADNKGFEGQYREDIVNIALKRFFPNVPMHSLDELLYNATDNDPINRPSMMEFGEVLKVWLEEKKDFEKRNQSEWTYIHRKLFPFIIPETAIWFDIDSIISILNLLGETKDLNHMFMPEGGGLDLRSAKHSIEDGCIELSLDGLIHIIKPKRLLFESFGFDVQWNYFRLETDNLKPSGVYSDNSYPEEELTEITPGHYLKRYYWDEGYDEDGESLPEDARVISRIFSGSFVIFLKTSIYNKISGTYDGRHNKMDAESFRQYICRSVDHFRNK